MFWMYFYLGLFLDTQTKFIVFRQIADGGVGGCEMLLGFCFVLFFNVSNFCSVSVQYVFSNYSSHNYLSNFIYMQ